MTRAEQAKLDENSKVSPPDNTWKNASERERRAIENAATRNLNRPERLRVEVEKTPTGLKTKAAKGGVEDSLAVRLADAMGTTSTAFTDATLGSIATVIASCSHGGVSSKDV